MPGSLEGGLSLGRRKMVHHPSPFPCTLSPHQPRQEHSHLKKSTVLAGGISACLPDILDKILTALSALGQSFDQQSERIKNLRQRLEGGRFHLAVLGQFKRGKSTLLNALLGNEVLPASVVPLTAIPTFVQRGSLLRASVHFRDEAESITSDFHSAVDLQAFLANYVTEAGNPRNHLGVSMVEVFHPSPILNNGVVLIDTPGIGSTYLHNTQTTLDFLAQCDAALFVLSADPPITETEVDFLEQIRKKGIQIVYILNKIDLLTEEEEAAAISFLKSVLRERFKPEEDERIFSLSARRAIHDGMTIDHDRRISSGIRQLEKYITGSLAREKEKRLQQAVIRKVTDIVEDVIARIHLTIRSLQLPIAELDTRLRSLEKVFQDADRQRTQIADLVEGDRKRLLVRIEEIAEQVRHNSRDALLKALLWNRDQVPRLKSDRQMEEVLGSSIPDLFEDEWNKASHSYTTFLNSLFEIHQKEVSEVITTIKRYASEAFDTPYRPPVDAEELRMTERPCWRTREWEATVNPILPSFLERLFPSRIRRNLQEKRWHGIINSLVVVNTERIRWTLIQALEKSVRDFNTEIARRIREVIQTTRTAIEGARNLRQSRAEEAEQEIIYLKGIHESLESLRLDLSELEV